MSLNSRDRALAAEIARQVSFRSKPYNPPYRAPRKPSGAHLSVLCLFLVPLSLVLAATGWNIDFCATIFVVGVTPPAMHLRTRLDNITHFRVVWSRSVSLIFTTMYALLGLIFWSSNSWQAMSYYLFILMLFSLYFTARIFSKTNNL